jgi:NAD(P)-dependent dehydrogenase (short-subunit alcohol dehydrogenase family)
MGKLQQKFALEDFSEALESEVKDFGIHVTMIEPNGYLCILGDLNKY